LIEPYLLLKTLHGMLGALLVVALVHPYFRPPGRWQLRLILGIATLLGGIGIFLYPTYRIQVKPARLWNAPWAARLFETKEHLGFFVLVLVAGGCLLSLKQAPEGRLCLRLAFLVALLTWTLGLVLGAVNAG
jgi:hypothetical protein